MTVTEVEVWPTHETVAVPLVLLRVVLTASDTDQVTVDRLLAAAAHPMGRLLPKARNCCDVPTEMLAVVGEILSDWKEQTVPPQFTRANDPPRTKTNAKNWRGMRASRVAIFGLEKRSVK